MEDVIDQDSVAVPDHDVLPGDKYPPHLDVRDKEGHVVRVKLLAVQVDTDLGRAGLDGSHIVIEVSRDLMLPEDEGLPHCVHHQEVVVGAPGELLDCHPYL